MKRAYFIGMDTHCQFCEIAAVNTRGDVVERDRCVTCIPALLEVIERVPRPRQLVIEEGPLAGWLWRHLHQAVDRMVVSEPRRNRLIALDGDKDDDLDAEKLAQLLRGGYVKACTRSRRSSVRCSSSRYRCITIGFGNACGKDCESAACFDSMG